VKTMLMVAAGVAVGLTLAMAVLIQVLERLLPLLLLAGLVVIALRLLRRRPQPRAIHEFHAFPAAAPSVAAPLSGPTRFPVVADDHAAAYLRWGPPPCEDLDAPVAVTSAHGRRS
jgi:hypothetical protein